MIPLLRRGLRSTSAARTARLWLSPKSPTCSPSSAGTWTSRPPILQSLESFLSVSRQPFVDQHILQTTGVLPGTYQIVIGFYRLSDGSRLALDSGGDSVILQTPVIVKFVK